MKPGGGRRKGSSFELDLAKDIAKAIKIKYGSDVRRTPASGALTTRSDLTIAPKHFSKFPFFLEAKHREGWDFWQYFNTEKWLPIEWYREAEEKLKVDPYYDPLITTVILVFKQNGKKPLIMMSKRDYDIWFSGCLEENFVPLPNMMLVQDQYSEQYVIFSWRVFLARYSKE